MIPTPDSAAPHRYHPLSIAAHWLTLLLLIGVYALINLEDAFPRGDPGRDLMKHWHFMLGLAVFVVVLARLSLRPFAAPPGITPPPPAWQTHAATAMHLLLYLFLVGMPLLGWLTLSAKGTPVPFFGLELPPLLAPDRALGHRLEDIHKTIGTLGYWLIGLHAAAALFHHYILRDDTLIRILPAWSVRRALSE